MRRFDKKKNIQKLNERLNKEKNSLTENSWADDLDPIYDEGTLDGDPLGPSPEDLGSWIEHEHRRETEDGIQRSMGLPEEEGEEDPLFTPSMGEPHPEDEPYDYERDERAFTPNSRFGEDVGEPMMDPMAQDSRIGTDNMNSEEIYFIKDCPSYMNPRQKYELLRKRFPDTQASYEDIEKIDYPNGLSESEGKKINILSEQSMKAFKKLCGVDMKKKR